MYLKLGGYYFTLHTMDEHASCPLSSQTIATSEYLSTKGSEGLPVFYFLIAFFFTSLRQRQHVSFMQAL